MILVNDGGVDDPAVAQIDHHVAHPAVVRFLAQEHQVPSLQHVHGGQALLVVPRGGPHEVDVLLVVPVVKIDLRETGGVEAGERLVPIEGGGDLHADKEPGDETGAVEGVFPLAPEVVVGRAQAVVNLGDHVLHDHLLLVVDLQMDAPGRIQRSLQGRRPFHGLHLPAPEEQGPIIAHIHAAARQRPGVGPLHDELEPVQHAAAALLQRFREEQDVALLQLSVGGHILPLGGLSVVVHQIPRRVEQPKQQGIVYVVLIEQRIALVVVQGLLVQLIVIGIEIQAQPTQSGVDPVRHGPLVGAGLQLPDERVGGIEIHGLLQRIDRVEVPLYIRLVESHALAGLDIAREPVLGGGVVVLPVVQVVDIEQVVGLTALHRGGVVGVGQDGHMGEDHGAQVAYALQQRVGRGQRLHRGGGLRRTAQQREQPRLHALAPVQPVQRDGRGRRGGGGRRRGRRRRGRHGGGRQRQRRRDGWHSRGRRDGGGGDGGDRRGRGGSFLGGRRRRPAAGQRQQRQQQKGYGFFTNSFHRGRHFQRMSV